MKAKRSQCCRSALVPLLFWMVVSSTWDRIGAAGLGHQEPASRVSVVVGSGTPQLERFAARELRRYLYELYGTQASPQGSPDPAVDLNILLGNPKTNPAIVDSVTQVGPRSATREWY